MTEPNGIDMKLRAVILLPTLIIGLALILVDGFVVDFMPSWLPLLFMFPALISLIVVERKTEDVKAGETVGFRRSV